MGHKKHGVEIAQNALSTLLAIAVAVHKNLKLGAVLCGISDF